MKILIVGYGNIGKHLYEELESLNPSIYDINIPEYKNTELEGYDIAFICVPTPSLNDGSCDIGTVEEVVSKISSKTIVIKSTVPVGTTQTLTCRYNKEIIFSPEYYGTTVQSKQQNFLVLGGDLQNCCKVAQLYYKVKDKDFKIKFTDSKTAELAKYMENCFLATKVTFCNEFAEIAKEFGICYEQLREIFIMDERVGSSHTFVFKDQPYYDSICLNKDIPALIQQSPNALLMKQVYEINELRKANYLVKEK